MARNCYVLAFAYAFLTLSSAAAQAGGTFAFTLENDMWFGTDREYTNGGLFTYTADIGQAPDVLETILAKGLGVTNAQRFQLRYGFGQSMFTPRDKEETQPAVDDRPFAGLLYVQLDATIERSRRVERFGVLLGLIGPAALGKQTQDFIHSLGTITRFQGWDNQLRNEPAIALNYDVAWPIDLAGQNKLQVRAEPSFGVALGNVATHAQAGVALSFGPDLGTQPNPVGIRPGFEPPRLFEPKQSFRWNLHIGAMSRAVAYSTLLDGNIFQDSLSVDRRMFQWEARGGLMLSYGRYWLGASAIWRGREYETQERIHRFTQLQFGMSL